MIINHIIRLFWVDSSRSQSTLYLFKPSTQWEQDLRLTLFPSQHMKMVLKHTHQTHLIACYLPQKYDVINYYFLFWQYRVKDLHPWDALLPHPKFWTCLGILLPLHPSMAYSKDTRSSTDHLEVLFLFHALHTPKLSGPEKIINQFCVSPWLKHKLTLTQQHLGTRRKELPTRETNFSWLISWSSQTTASLSFPSMGKDGIHRLPSTLIAGLWKMVS